jgi:hypothetical protein
MDMHGNNQIVWYYQEPLTAALVLDVPVGMVGSGVTVARCANVNRITWGIISEFQFLLEVQGSADINFAVFDILVSQVVPAATYTTPYQLGGNLGLTGEVVLTRPFIRVRVTDQETDLHDYTRLYFKAREA